MQNSTLIVDYDKDKYPFNKLEVGEKGFSGVNDGSLEYTGLSKNATRNDPYVEFGREYNKWPTLYEEPDYIAQYPAKIHLNIGMIVEFIIMEKMMRLHWTNQNV